MNEKGDITGVKAWVLLILLGYGALGSVFYAGDIVWRTLYCVTVAVSPEGIEAVLCNKKAPWWP